MSKCRMHDAEDCEQCYMNKMPEVEEYIPFLFHGEAIEKCFEGRLPVVGDTIEVVCYEVTGEGNEMRIKCKWRVKE